MWGGALVRVDGLTAADSAATVRVLCSVATVADSRAGRGGVSRQGPLRVGEGVVIAVSVRLVCFHRRHAELRRDLTGDGSFARCASLCRLRCRQLHKLDSPMTRP